LGRRREHELLLLVKLLTHCLLLVLLLHLLELVDVILQLLGSLQTLLGRHLLLVLGKLLLLEI
jgi:hypothetical protein